MCELTSFSFFLVQSVKKEEGEHVVSTKPKRTKEEIEEARHLKIKKKEEEEQSRWRWLGNASLHLALTWTLHTPRMHTIKNKTPAFLKCILVFS